MPCRPRTGTSILRRGIVGVNLPFRFRESISLSRIPRRRDRFLTFRFRTRSLPRVSGPARHTLPPAYQTETRWMRRIIYSSRYVSHHFLFSLILVPIFFLSSQTLLPWLAWLRCSTPPHPHTAYEFDPPPLHMDTVRIAGMYSVF